MKKFFTIIFGRVVYTSLFIIIQIGGLALMLRYFAEYFWGFYSISILFSVLAGLHVLNRDMNPDYKLAWLIPIMRFPVFGGLMYAMFGKTRMSQKEARRVLDAEKEYRFALKQEDGAMEELELEDSNAAAHAKYIRAITLIAPQRHTQTMYLPTGEKYFEALKEALEKAQRFIFLEYFIIEQGVMWNEILEILARKVKEGVDIRVMYDDLGCMFTLPQRYTMTLEKLGIKACVFHRFNSILNARFNTRDHRKICVVDGIIGFTGGVNLADEYINVYEKHGHWKDSGIMLTGEAVWSLTVMFLSMWDCVYRDNKTFTGFAPMCDTAEIPDDGYVLPYHDTPMDDEPVGENVYINLIYRAKRYVYITTPYLIVDDKMLAAMRTASRSGVDIRVITPGIPDKKFVNIMTKSYYEPLLNAGVRIFEYTPGFIHSKTLVSDDELAVVGTVNLDYRSFYLHHECAVWLYKSKAVGQVKEDFIETLDKCAEVTLDTMEKKNALQDMARAVLRVFAPLM